MIKEGAPIPVNVEHDFDKMLDDIVTASRSGDSILIMSNGGFNGIHGKLLAKLKK